MVEFEKIQSLSIKPTKPPVKLVVNECVNCGYKLKPGKNFCGNCGTQVHSLTDNHCGECGYKFNQYEKFCGDCGEKRG